MARQLRIEYPGAFYHVTSRGNERKVVFRSKRDREKFLEYLGSASERYDAVVHVYCLMDNHLLIETPEGNLSQMQIHLCHRYTSARLREIGAHFGIGESAVNQNSRRFTERLSKDRRLRRITEQVRRELRLSSV